MKSLMKIKNLLQDLGPTNIITHKNIWAAHSICNLKYQTPKEILVVHCTKNEVFF